MRTRSLAAGVGPVCALLLAACGGRVEESSAPNYDVPSTLFRSGTRLKARVLRADSAPPLLSAIVDSEEHLECFFHRAGDGELRCLPWPLKGIDAYADASCEEPLVSSPAFAATAACSTRLLAAVSSMQHFSCDAEPVSVFELERADDVSKIYRKAAGGCEEGSPSDEMQTFGLYRLGRMVEPSRFVRAEMGEVALSERLTQRTFDAEDGSSWTADFYDETMKTGCQPKEARESDLPSVEDAPVACLPTAQSAIEWTSSFADCSADGLFVSAVEQACYDLGQAPSAYMHVGSRWASVSQEPTTEQLFGFGENGCVPLTGRMLFKPDGVVDNSAWLALEQAELGTRRLRTKALRHEGHVVAVPGAFLDSKENAACAPYVTSEGFRCIADGSANGGVQGAAQRASLASARYYADSAQQERLASSAFTPAPAFYVAKAKSGRSCTEMSGPFQGLFLRGRFIEAAYAVRDEYGGPVFDENGEPVDREKVGALTFYRLGPEVPWSKFPALEEFVE